MIKCDVYLIKKHLIAFPAQAVLNLCQSTANKFFFSSQKFLKCYLKTEGHIFH